jgi:hypothetical protein
MTLFLKIDFSCLFLGGLGKYDSIKKSVNQIGNCSVFQKNWKFKHFWRAFWALDFCFLFLIFAFKRKKQFGREV